MEKKWQFLFFLVWFGYALISTLLLFTNGFLLNKTTITSKSNCSLYSMPACVNEDSNKHSCSSEDVYNLLDHLNESQHICVPQKSKVIVLLIDAFRYDFALYNESAPDTTFQNKVPAIHDLLESHPNSTRLYKFIADPPTTTMQRLKALTTGTLPTFIDAGSNFATPEINDDNIIEQAVKYGKNVVFLGDDTWKGLYPKQFLRSYPFPSFNVYDLDTVDMGVTANLYKEIEKKDWSLLIAHYLGVDHCGHRYGPLHEEMTRKLSEMNDVISNITSQLDEHTVLFVIGDHGMTATGDHGGESEDEVTAAMFVHSKKLLLPSHKSLALNSKSVKQIDLVPTISTILGIPIPYSNLGYLILDSLPSEGIKDNWKVSLFALWGNVQQIMSYINHYSQQFQAFDTSVLSEHYKAFEDLKSQVDSIRTKNDFTVFAGIAENFIASLRSMCEKEWTQFNSLDMIRGLLNFFATFFFVFIITDGICSKKFHDVFSGRFLLGAYTLMSLVLFVGLLLVLLGYLPSVPSVIYFMSCLCSTIMLAIMMGLNWMKIPEHWYGASKRRRWIDRVSRCVLLVSACGLFSNSFIIEEGYLLMYLWFSLLLVTIIDLNIPGKSKYRRNMTKVRVFSATVLAFLTLRYTYYFTKCREEQQWCYAKQHFNNSAVLLGASIFAFASLVTLARMWLKHTGNLAGYSLGVLVGNFAPAAMVALMGGHWALQGLQDNPKHGLFEPWKIDLLAWGVYALFILSVLAVALKPLLIDVKLRQYPMPQNSSNIIPQLFRQIRTRLNDKSDSENVPVICGLGTVYSAVFVSVGLCFGLLWAFLLGSRQAAPVAILFLVAAFVLFISSITRYEKAIELNDIMKTPNIFIIIWSLLSYYFFYSTGHQPTFSSIPWDAAFLGTGGKFESVYLQGFLVIVNIFGSHILMGLTLPLLLIAPFTIQFVKQDLRPKKIDHNNDLLRGDIVLYENEQLFFNNACILCAKYILISAMRVFFSMMTATIHCRHLMVWSIFAPKLIFESIALIVTVVSVILGYLLLILVNYKLARLFAFIMQKNR